MLRLCLGKLHKLFRLLLTHIVSPVIVCLTLPIRHFRIKKYLSKEYSPSSILISFFGRGLGDCLYFSGLLKTIRFHFPEAKLRLACLKQMESYFHGNPFIDELIPCPDYEPLWNNFRQFLGSALQVRKKMGSVDLLLNLCPTLALEPAIWDSLIPKKYSVGIGDSLKRVFYDEFVPIDWSKHFYEAMLDGLKPLVLKPQPPLFWIPENNGIEGLVPPELFSKKAVIIAPGGKRNVEAPKEYCWIFEGFPQVIEALVSRGYPVILIGADYDRAMIEKIKPHALLFDLIGRTTIPQVFKIVQQFARLAVCNNSGLLHIASVLNIPTVSYADPEENMLRWSPYPNSDRHTIFQDQANQKVSGEAFLVAILEKLGEGKKPMATENSPAYPLPSSGL